MFLSTNHNIEIEMEIKTHEIYDVRAVCELSDLDREGLPTGPKERDCDSH